MSGPGWSQFLADYHAAHPGITEDLLTPMRGPGGRGPYAWLVEGLPAAGRVWDVACGSAPVATEVGLARYAGVDSSAAELAEARRRRPGVRVELGDGLRARPVGTPAAVTVAMALMLLPLEVFLAHLATFVPPGASLAAIVPTREGTGGTDYGRLLSLLAQEGVGYRAPLPVVGLAGRFGAAGFELLVDEVATFSRPVRGDVEIDLVVASFYAQGAGAAERRAARAWLRQRSADPAYALHYPLRRLRARRLT